MKTNMKTTIVVSAILATTLTNNVYAAQGVKANPTGPFVVPTLPTPAFTPAQGAALHGFDITGFLQDATTTACGGTATVNNIKITIPCNTIVQMPANTFTWNAMIAAGPSLTIAGGVPYPYELHVIGNVVNGEYRAALLYMSQQSVNSVTGVIQSIDYTTGNLLVKTANSATPTMVVQINDPIGRFGRAQSPDPRFSVDDANPTIHAATGYPMCVPRTPTDPNTTAVDDPLCPKKNRPKASGGSPCRLFGQTGITLPISGELTVTPAGNFCTQFVMKAPFGTVPTAFVPAQYIVPTAAAQATEPDAKQQAPFEAGDTIMFSGTLLPSGVISAHTVEANVGIYTQPKSQPSYLALGEFGVGTADPTLLSVGGAAQETQNRIFLETETSDISSPVDIYMVDVDPATGKEHNRWVSMFEMTGDCAPANLALPASAYCRGLSGGLYTQFTQAAPNRARLRLAKATNGILTQPSRNMRVMSRSLCYPEVPVAAGLPADLDTLGHSAALDKCYSNKVAAPIANGLVVGQYTAPVFGFIFPENTKPGDPIVPNDFWSLPFLVNGDVVGPLNPTPY